MSFDMRDTDGDDLQPSAEINVTPFIDVMLVLLIIFMVTAPLLTQGMKVDLPKAGSGIALDAQKSVTITIAADGIVQVGNDVVPVSEIVPSVRAALGDSGEPIRIKGDAGARYGTVIEIIDLLSRNGMTKLQFLTVAQSSR